MISRCVSGNLGVYLIPPKVMCKPNSECTNTEPTSVRGDPRFVQDLAVEGLDHQLHDERIREEDGNDFRPVVSRCNM